MLQNLETTHKSKIAGLHNRVYPLILKNYESPIQRPKTKQSNRRFSQESSHSEFITEIYNENLVKTPEAKHRNTKSQQNNYSNFKEKTNKDTENKINKSICLEVPRISYSTFKQRPTSQGNTEKYFIPNTFYASPRSKYTLYTRAPINPTKEIKFKPIIVKKIKRMTTKKCTGPKAEKKKSGGLNEKIKIMHELIGDPMIIN